MDRNEIFEAVRDAVSEVLDISKDRISPATQLRGIGADLCEKAVILLLLEKRYGITLPSNPGKLLEQLNQPSVQGLCNYMSCGLRHARTPMLM